jgi:RND family efflux transporter MFP subunit
MTIRGKRCAGRWLVRLIAAWCAVAVVAASPGQSQEQPARVEVDPVRTEPLSQTVPVLGRIVTQQQGPVAARVAGLVERVGVEVGDRVEEGQPLIWLDSEPLGFELDLARAEHDAMLAELETTLRELELLQGELDRIAALRNSAAFSKAQLVDKQNEIEVARSRIGQARARLQQYRANLELKARDLEDAVIRAPYAGVVSVRQVSPGAFIRIGDPVVMLIDDHRLEIEAEVPSDRVAALRPGTEVSVRLDDGTRHTADVRAVVPEEDPLTRTRAV